ncbi:MAG: glycosyltransferase, partial [Desulfovibrio sp.]|nr:glycosyltransferase [Desulfovibrio sp.]
MAASLIFQAKQAFDRGNYLRAHALYAWLARRLGEQAFHANREICKRRLASVCTAEHVEDVTNDLLSGLDDCSLAEDVAAQIPATLYGDCLKPEHRFRVAVILDNFSWQCLAPEAELLRLHPSTWRQELERFAPDFLLVESAWLGEAGEWKAKINPCSPELRAVIAWCRIHEVPTVFWNKEDPPHYKEFLPAAQLFDFVFTTDANCLPQYRQDLGHSRVHVLPFAVQPKLFHAQGPEKRKAAFCFAGSWFTPYPQRNADLLMLVDTLKEFGPVDIYDRHAGEARPECVYPEVLQPYIAGSVAYTDLGHVYRQYQFGINVNSVTDSPTMCSRRVFEMLASGMVVISNKCRAIENLFGDVVLMAEDADDLRKKVRALLDDPDRVQRLRDRGQRAVLAYHTYAQRLVFMVKKLGGWGMRPSRDYAHLANKDLRVAVSMNPLSFACYAPEAHLSTTKVLKERKILLDRAKAGKVHGWILKEQGLSQKAVIVRACSSHELYIFDIPKGEYVLTITHQDDVLAANSKSLVAWLDFPHMTSTAKLANRIGLYFANGMYFYAGGGKKGRDDTFFYRRQSIIFESDTPYVRLRWQNRLHKDVDICGFSLSMVDKIADLSYLRELVRTQETATILYANVNVNIIDGSSVWFSSMASILSRLGPVIVISRIDDKNSLITANIGQEAVQILYPKDFLLNEITPVDAAKLINSLDCILVRLKNIVVRGLDETLLLTANRCFKGRIYPYLTNIFAIKNGRCVVNADIEAHVRRIVPLAGGFLCQTPLLRDMLERMTGGAVNCAILPPPVPDDFAAMPASVSRAGQNALCIGYAGKITPVWGVVQLLCWAERLRREGLPVTVTIAFNKIMARRNIRPRFTRFLQRYFDKDWVEVRNGLNRVQVSNMLSSMNFVWAWRPAFFENNTVELSTKLVEGAILARRCICYPSRINQELLGKGYPWFARDFTEFRQAVQNEQEYDMQGLATSVLARHSFARSAQTLNAFLRPGDEVGSKCICFAGHDFKFIDPFISSIKKKGFPVRKDVWEWGGPRSLVESKLNLNEADIVFCEWGLANAVWYSRNIREGQRLIIRIHAQEVREKAQKFGQAIVMDNVDKVIFVSPEIRNRGLELWGWPENKTIVIPNFLLTDEYRLRPRHGLKKPLRLGLLGIIPKLKRLDRALDLLVELAARGIEAHLHVKGNRPEELAYMKAPGRREELEWYEQLYARIADSQILKARVHFERYGNDVAQWYENIDV